MQKLKNSELTKVLGGWFNKKTKEERALENLSNSTIKFTIKPKFYGDNEIWFTFYESGHPPRKMQIFKNDCLYDDFVKCCSREEPFKTKELEETALIYLISHCIVF